MTEPDQQEDKGKVKVSTKDTRIEVDGPVMPREFYDHLARLSERIGRVEKALIVLAIIAGPRFVASAIDVFTATAQAMGVH